MAGAGACLPTRRAPSPAPDWIDSKPPPLSTVIERRAVGLAETSTYCGPPSLWAVTAYGPPGTVSRALPPSVVMDTDCGSAANATRAVPPPESTETSSGALVNAMSALPPSVLTVAVTAAMSRASRAPPPVSASSGPVRPVTTRLPFSVFTVSGPRTSLTCTGPPPESRLASATPETISGPPSVPTVS